MMTRIAMAFAHPLIENRVNERSNLRSLTGSGLWRRSSRSGSLVSYTNGTEVVGCTGVLGVGFSL
jgi:hypothetical protein